MRSGLWVAVRRFVGGAAVACVACVAAAQDGGGGARVAVVELFTSEGCSSCPAADRVALDLHRSVGGSREGGRGGEGAEVIVLAYHVDFWDALGWKDRFSLASASARQRRYAQVRGSPRVYTPQMIVNGGEGFVGSDAARARAEVASALGDEMVVGVGGEVSVEGGVVSVGFVIDAGERAGASHDVVVALVEEGLVSEVERGENAGRRLEHPPTIRAFRAERIGDAAEGVAELAVPEGVDVSACRVVVYVQNSWTLEVVGASVLGVDAGR